VVLTADSDVARAKTLSEACNAPLFIAKKPLNHYQTILLLPFFIVQNTSIKITTFILY
jgi:hypothetical protein